MSFVLHISSYLYSINLDNLRYSKYGIICNNTFIYPYFFLIAHFYRETQTLRISDVLCIVIWLNSRIKCHLSCTSRIFIRSTWIIYNIQNTKLFRTTRNIIIFCVLCYTHWDLVLTSWREERRVDLYKATTHSSYFLHPVSLFPSSFPTSLFYLNYLQVFVTIALQHFLAPTV